MQGIKQRLRKRFKIKIPNKGGWIYKLWKQTERIKESRIRSQRANLLFTLSKIVGMTYNEELTFSEMRDMIQREAEDAIKVLLKKGVTSE